jgi:large subunit ribosomal protein L12
MEYVYAAMLIHKSGGKIDEDTVKKVIQAAGGKPDDGRVKALVAALNDVDIEAAIKDASVAPVAVAPANIGGEAAAAEGKKENKEEKKKSAEEAAAGLGALFG